MKIRHSNVLCWLMDPAGNHKEGGRFTRIFSRAVPVGNIEDAAELREAMVRLMNSAEYCEMRGRIRRAIGSL